MKSKGTWQHKNSMDVFYRVLSVRTFSDYVKVKYDCWIPTSNGPMRISNALKAKIKNEDLKNWHEVSYG